MNIRRTLLAGALTLGLLGSIAAPAVIAADTADVEVEIGIGGTFAVVICDAGELSDNGIVTDQEGVIVLDDVENPTASAAGSATGGFLVCYQDDVSYRTEGFVTLLSVDDFESETAPTTIANTNLKILGTTGIAQGQWTSGNPNGLVIGDIGTLVDQADPGGQPNPWYTEMWWTDNNSFGGDVRVHYGLSGVGTIWSAGSVGVELSIPVGTVPGVYTSVVTATVITAPEFTRP